MRFQHIYFCALQEIPVSVAERDLLHTTDQSPLVVPARKAKVLSIIPDCPITTVIKRFPDMHKDEPNRLITDARYHYSFPKFIIQTPNYNLITVVDITVFHYYFSVPTIYFCS